MTRRLVFPLGLGLALLASAAPASAATQVQLNEGPFQSVLVITDATNDDDAITLTDSGSTTTITDTGTGGITTADPDCSVVNATTVSCADDPPDPALPAPPNVPVNVIQLTLGNGTDSFVNQDVKVQVQESDSSVTGNKTVVIGPSGGFINTGSGNDNITGGPAFEFVQSQAGADTMALGGGGDFAAAGVGDDVVDMGDGNDQMSEDAGSNGADLLNGGPGHDSVGYGGIAPVAISLNGQADDGRAGEGDNVFAEFLFGGAGSDTLVGDGEANRFFGGEGDDLITGAGGDDQISPDAGNDTVDAGDGADTVFAGSESNGADLFDGGAGGNDLVDYCCGADPIAIAQDGQANDGRAGEGDNLAGFEGFAGGDGADTITYGGRGGFLFGNGGNDVLVGHGGGGQYFAGAGDDVIIATEAATPASASATPRAAVVAADELDCDVGFDTVAASAMDQISTNCERQGATVASESSKVNSKGKAGVLVDCPLAEGAPCAGKLVLISNGKQIGKGSFQVANGQAKKATAKLSKKGSKALAKSGGSLLVSAEAQTNETPAGVSARGGTVQLISGH